MLNKTVNDSIKISSARTYDDVNENLHVENNVLTKEGIAQYLGKELTGWEDMGLDPEKVYTVYRPKDILEEYKDVFNRLPITFEHPKQEDPTNIPKDDIIGTSGENAFVELDDNGVAELKNGLTFWDKDIVKSINDNIITGLSCGTILKYKKKSGVWNKQPYDIEVCEMIGNHIALTKNPRIKGSVVSDSAENIIGGFMKNLAQKWFNTKIKTTKDSIDELELIKELLDSDEMDKDKAIEAFKKAIEVVKGGVQSEPVSDEENKDKASKDECNPSKDQNTEPSKDEGKDMISKDEVKKMIENALKEKETQDKETQDEENKNKEIAQDCADKLGLGKMYSATADSMFRSILKSQNIPVTDSMDVGLMKGLAMGITLSNSKSEKQSFVVGDSIPENLKDLL